MERKKITILAIDDNQDNLTRLKTLTKDIFPDALTCTAVSGKKGLELAAAEEPDVILLDIEIAGMNGFKVCQKLKADKKLSDIPVVFLTALKGDKESLNRALECGAEGFLSKPIDESEFTAQIRAMVKIKAANIEKHTEKERLTTLVGEQTRELFVTHTATMNLMEDLNKENEARRKSEDALQKSQARYRMVVRLSSEFAYSCTQTDENGFVVDWITNAFFDLSGYTETELHERRCWMFIVHPDDYALATEPLYRLRGGEADEKEFRIITKEGDIRWFANHMECQVDSTESSGTRIFGAVRDVTVRKQAEESLRQYKERLEFALSGTNDGIWDVMMDTKAVYLSPRGCEILGYGPEELEKSVEQWNQLVHPEDLPATNAALTAYLESKTPIFIVEQRLKTSTGDWKWILARGKAVSYDQDGKALRMVGTHTDISDRKRAENALEESNERLKKINEELQIAKEKAEESDRLKTAFLHNISHEIRTPMNAIIGFSGFLNEPDLPPERRQFFTDIIVRSSNQLLSIISDIISIATIEAGQDKITEKEIDLVSTLKLLHEQFLFKAEKKNICLTLQFFITEQEGTIISDEVKLVEVLTNLIGNALKFTKQGCVTFGCQEKNNELEFFVKDTGIGIPPEMHEEVFKRFHQVDSTTTRQYGGSGLGLSISKAYVELLGGKIWLSSELDKGTSIYFTIPYHKVQKNTLSEMQSQNIITLDIRESKTLLVAEDEDTNFLLLKQVFSDLDINIIRASNGLEAVEICKSKHIDLVLMDLKMPVMDGYEATKQIREFMPDVPIIAQTAFTENGDKKKAFACGCTDFISKPFKKKLVLSKINEQLDKKIMSGQAHTTTDI